MRKGEYNAPGKMMFGVAEPEEWKRMLNGKFCRVEKICYNERVGCAANILGAKLVLGKACQPRVNGDRAFARRVRVATG